MHYFEMYKIRIIKEPKNNPLNIKYESTVSYNKKEFIKFKKQIRKDKDHDYNYTILNEVKEPLYLKEKIEKCWTYIKKRMFSKKLIWQMKEETIKREYYHKKYFLIIIILTAIITAIITILINKIN